MNLPTRRLGSNRGSARLWLEGPILTNAGWNHGDRFTITFGTGRITIERDPDGRRKVAGTAHRPIIDTNTDKLLNSLGCQPGSTVSIEISARFILIRKAP